MNLGRSEEERIKSGDIGGVYVIGASENKIIWADLFDKNPPEDKPEYKNLKASKELWQLEYQEGHAIPSSTDHTASRALRVYDNLIDWNLFSPILDAGCGNGRNSMHLAREFQCKVHANDYSQTAISILKDKIEVYKNEYFFAPVKPFNIEVENKNLEGKWDYPDSFFGAVLDSYVSCHIIDDTERLEYLREMHRVIKPGGLVYSCVMEFGDEYYYNILHNYKSSDYIVRYKLGIVTDPRNGITKKLFRDNDPSHSGLDFYSQFYQVGFELVYSVKLNYYDELFGKKYRRSILTFIGKKKD